MISATAPRPGVEVCEGCGATVPDAPGPAHAYGGAAPGCWAAYGEVLARQYSDPRFSGARRLTVDAYSVQHPGRPGPGAIRSVAIHLMGLHLRLDLDVEHARAEAALQAALRFGAADFTWLDPPWPRGAITVHDVRRAGDDPRAHRRRVHEWATAVWGAWSEHHGRVREWTALALDPRARRASRGA